MLLIAASMPSLAQDFVTIGKIEYKLLGNSKAAVYKGHDCYGDVTIPKSITADGETYQVSEILGKAFIECGAMTSIRIPKTITTIWSGAFKGCDNLRELHISDIAAWCNINFINYNFKDSPFDYAQDLYLDDELITDLVIPDGVAKIVKAAFRGCKSLISVTIGNSVTEIEEGAFFDCAGLRYATIGNSVTTIGIGVFAGCPNLTSVTIPPSVTKIDNSFGRCKNLEEVHISDLSAWCRIDFIQGDNPNPLAFAERLYLGNELITDLKIPDNVNIIKYKAFYGWDGARTINTGNSLEYIASRVFMFCSNLTSVTIGSSVKGIGDQAFYDCRRLKSIICLSEKPCGLGKEVFYNDYNATLYVPVGSKEAYQNSDWKDFKNIVEFDPASRDEALMTVIGGMVYCGDPKTGTAKVTRLLNGDGDVIIQESITLNGKTYKVTEIGDNIFTGCCEMTSVRIPDSVVEIGNSAFDGCSILMSASIGNSVSTIGEKAFYGCYSLMSATIGKSVKSIGDYAFYVNRLNTIYCLSATPSSIGNNVFRNYDATLYVPSGSINFYRNDPEWGKFKDIREFDASGVEKAAEDDSLLPTDYYSLDGVKVATAAPGERPADLPAGVYITRCGSNTAKTIIR